MHGTHAARLTTPAVMTGRLAWLRARTPALSRLRPTAAAAAAGAPIRPGERVLISLRQVSTALVIATERAIYRQEGAEASHSWSRLGWDEVDRVLWDSGQHALTLTRTGGKSPPMVLLVPRGAPLAELARERVTATTLARAPLLSGGRVCGWLAARRPPGSDTVRWVLTLRDATAASDPALQSCVARAIAALEADLGLASSRPPSTPHGW